MYQTNTLNATLDNAVRTSDNTYILDGFIFVEDGVALDTCGLWSGVILLGKVVQIEDLAGGEDSRARPEAVIANYILIKG